MKQYVIETLIGFFAFWITYVIALYYIVYREDRNYIEKRKREVLDKIEKAIEKTDRMYKL